MRIRTNIWHLIGRLNQTATDGIFPLGAFKPSSSDSADRGRSIIRVKFQPWYIVDVLSINNPNFSNWIPLIYPKEREITETASSASFLDKLSIRLYDKRDDFNLSIINFAQLDTM